MTIAALLLSQQFFDARAVDAAQLRDARPAVRQRLDRRHPDPLCRPAGADGGAAMGLGHGIHARPLRLAGGRSRSLISTHRLFRRLSPRTLRSHEDPGRPRPRQPESSKSTEVRPPAGAVVDHAGAPGLHGVDGRSTRTIPALFIGGFMFFLGFTRATTALPDACSTSRRRCWSGSSWRDWSFTADFKDGGLRRCWRACDQCGMFWVATLLTAFNDNALITYLATLVPELRSR